MSTNKRFRIVLTTCLVLAFVFAWMHGKGTFLDSRSGDGPELPIAIPAPTPQAGDFDAKGAERGKLVFNRKGKCASCHVPGLFAHAKDGFSHDGRFATLEDVVRHYDDFLELGLSEGETKDLVRYLKSL